MTVDRFPPVRGKRLICGLLAASILLAVLALPAVAAVKLSIEAARDKAELYAKHTCGHDPYCVEHGVTNCRRRGSHRVECGIYLKRSTPVQGRYQCEREVRLVLEPDPFRPVVANATTNTSSWTCRR
jgi:hypothetical protein